MKAIPTLKKLIVGASLSTMTLTSHALIVGPYSPDAATLHLWHLDASSIPALDLGTSPTNLVTLVNGATLGNASFSGFGTALNTLDGGQDATTADGKDAGISPSAANPPGNITFTYANATNGAFTYEAIVRIDFDPAKNLGPTANGGNNRNAACQIISCESTVNGSRIFQFRIFPKGNTLIAGVIATDGPYLTFENVRAISGNQNSIYAPIPMTGPDAIVSNGWYHVAVTYNGAPNTTGNIKFFWTALDASRAVANEIAITSAVNSLSGLNPLSSTATPPVIGNIGRNMAGAGANFLGLIDEVRMSSVARRPSDMMFNSESISIISQPSNQLVPVGIPASFSVISSGVNPVYQWRHAGVNISGATLDTLRIPSVQSADAGNYDVVISNNFNSVTSSIAVLTLRIPNELTWIGSAGSVWDTSLLNWDTTSDGMADALFSTYDNATFNNSGSGVSTVSLTNVVTPLVLTVNATADYTFTSTTGGGIGGFGRLVKSNTGTLILDTDNNYAGDTIIQGGTVQIGSNGGARGSLGTGPITNNAKLVVSRTGAVNFNNSFAGNGTFTNLATNVVTIAGTNTFSGPITLNAGALVLQGAQAKGTTTQYTLMATANAAPTRLTLGGGITLGAGTSLSLLGTSEIPDFRNTISTSDATNRISGAIVLDGGGIVQFVTDGTSYLILDGPTINSPSYTGKLILRGNGTGTFANKVNTGGHVSKTDGGTWTISSTGNYWTNTDVAGGIFKMGATGVLPSNISLNITSVNGTLDLAGFDQQVSLLTGPGFVANSSTNSDSVLAVSPSGPSLFSGVIQDSVSGGTHRVGLTVLGGNQTLSGTNTYTGPTTILSGGALTLFIQGNLLNSSVIDIRNGALFNASFRDDQTLVLNAAQTLKGDGAFSIWGNLVNHGTLTFKLNKSGGTLSNDSLNGATAITFGGTLKLTVSGDPLTTADSFQIFSASGYSGSFANIVPSAPAAGLAWDTSTLASDGVLRITTSSVNPTPTTFTAQVSGNQLTLQWPEDHTGWRLQSQTNSVTTGISTNWFDVSGSTFTNKAVFTLDPTKGSVFFRMVYP